MAIANDFEDNLLDAIFTNVKEPEVQLVQSDPLSKAIIMDSIAQLTQMLPALHFSQILKSIHDPLHMDDKRLAEELSKLVDSVRRDGKIDSFSEAQFSSSTLHLSLHSTEP